VLDLERILSQPEGQYFERKSLWAGSREKRTTRDRREVRDEIAEYVAAFANADGGTLVLGVEDDGLPTGHGYPAEEVANMLRVPERRLKPPQGPGRTELHGGQELLVFEVTPAEQAVMVVGNGFPRRVDDTVVQESEAAINAIKARNRVESVELDVAQGVGFGSLDVDLIRKAQNSAGLEHLAPEDYLCERRLADYRGSELVLRKGAVLLFASRARYIEHPNAGVRIFQVHGTERLTGSRHNVHELPRVEGSLPSVIERAYDAIGGERGLIRRSARLHDLFFREMPEYPTFVWQEALVNAVAHRDYRIQGRGVEVYVYEDRMEISNPGALLPEVELDRLRRREPVHYSRNPRITRVLAELSIMREQGEGIPRMFEEMEQSWLPMPELRAGPDAFTVILRNEPILQTPDAHWVDYVRSLPLSHRQRRALVAYPRGWFSNAEYQRLNEVDRDLSYRDLRELLRLGLIATEGRGRGTRYLVNIPPREAQKAPTPSQVLTGRMQERGYIQNSDYRDVFGVDRYAASKALAQLTLSRVLRQEGERRGTRYRPGPRWDAWVSGEARGA
jgi:ATP-dependent DNA helicase RecG